MAENQTYTLEQAFADYLGDGNPRSEGVHPIDDRSHALTRRNGGLLERLKNPVTAQEVAEHPKFPDILARAANLTRHGISIAPIGENLLIALAESGFGEKVRAIPGLIDQAIQKKIKVGHEPFLILLMKADPQVQLLDYVRAKILAHVTKPEDMNSSPNNEICKIVGEMETAFVYGQALKIKEEQKRAALETTSEPHPHPPEEGGVNTGVVQSERANPR